MNRLRSRLLLIACVTIAVLASTGCSRHKATTEDCKAVLDRIIELELGGSGYRDDVLRARWKSDLGRRFALDLQSCEGLTMKSDVRRCLRDARTTDEIVHRCMD